MGEVSGYYEPLLKERPEFNGNKKIPLWVSSAKLALKVVMWAIFILWATFIFLYPSDFMNKFSEKLIHATRDTVFGITGSLFLLFSAPILIIAFLAILHIYLSGEDEVQVKKAGKGATLRLWTFPVIVDGPFGVVTAAELIGIVIFSVYTIWAVVMYTIKNQEILAEFQLSIKEKCIYMLELTGLRFGFIGLICLAFLFLPVARGSILLRLIGIPFEHATRYHVWLGHLTMTLFTLHGLFYVIGWAMQGRLVEELLAWKHVGIANLPGVISLAAGLLMWATSMPGVRRINFELFFYTHQLYIVFVVFFALHVGDFVFSMSAAGIFLFMLDRFLRFCQSRRAVDVLSAKCFPCGTVELVLSKPENLHYNALGWVFLQVRELSWLQWHPFSVSSSPLDGKNHLAILIKVLGGWTEKLKEQISSLSEGKDQSETLLKHQKITASVEGPYGHESAYHLTYENLILVAGGIGISPFLAILSDVLHHINEGKPLMTKNILVVWAIKYSEELPLLQTVDMEGICPFFSDKLNLEIKTYITREKEPPLEEGIVSRPVSSCVFPSLTGRRMSVLAGTGNVVWSGLYLVASTIGLAIFVAMLNVLYINPFNVTYWWYKGLLFMGCMAASIMIFGGLVICLWQLWERKTTSTKEDIDGADKLGIKQQSESPVDKISGQEQYVSTIRYGQRPDFGEIFGTMSERWGNADIGVIICGPSALQTSVAKECRTQNLKRRSNQSIFHFNSHSFDL